MSRQGSTDTRHAVADAVSSAAITVAGAWLLVIVAGTVALLAVLLVAGIYAPLRCRSSA